MGPVLSHAALSTDATTQVEMTLSLAERIRRLEAQVELASQRGHTEGIGGLGGADTEVVAVGVGADGAGLLEEPTELLEVRLADLPGVHLDAPLVFQREEERRIFIGEGELGWIDQVKDGDVVLAGAEGQKPPEGVGSLVQEVREDAHQRARRAAPGGAWASPGEVPPCAACRPPARGRPRLVAGAGGARA